MHWKMFAAVAVAAAGALLITKPEQALMIALTAGGAALVGYIVAWALDMYRNGNDDGFR